MPPIDTELNYSYRVILADGPGRSGTYVLTLDPNSYCLDEFGRALGSTLMAPFCFTVRLEPVARADGLALHELRSDERLPARMRLVLVEDPRPRACPARLLLLDEQGFVAQIVHLHASVV